MELENSLSQNGYTFVQFQDLEPIHAIQNIIKQTFPCSPTALHQHSLNEDERLAIVKKTKDKIVESGFIKKLLYSNANLFMRLLGPDIDIQTDIYLRVSRPLLESDVIDWHRDTFYGNSYWELNFWFPLFPLDEGAGLMIIEGSHLTSSKNIQSIQDQDPFRSTVTKGSLANELGYLYAPKSDDTITYRESDKVKLLTPQLGQGVLFFTHVAHRAQNSSINTRITADLRVRNMLAPTNTKPGYYQPLTRGVIATCVEKMISLNS